ncbi:MAG: Zn-dependent hydrolase [Chloroflexi bacterium]|nr:Zn-dependent hydrolase [Chloroflexota bacterium]
MSKLQVNGERLWHTIMETARFGRTEKGGVCRLTLSDADRQVRDWLVRECRAAGCDVSIDEMGTIFARRSGKDNTLLPIAIGSHLDTQPSGGKFDGIAGVLSGLEVLRTLNEAGYTTTAPLELIDWTNEEGSRFQPPMLASGVFAGVFERDFAYASEDRDGKKFGAELARIGYRGERRCPDHKLGAYFELHIEQGPVLEKEGILIGAVTGMQGQKWYEITVTGQDAHAGTTPMPARRDAMVACARMVMAVQAIALDHSPLAVATVGHVVVRPNSRNVVPGSVFFTVDLRHPDEKVLLQIDQELRKMVAATARDSDVKAKLVNNWNVAPMEFNADCINRVRNAAKKLGYRHRDIISGAGHDAVYIARVVPTGMIFVPCENGISHNELENTRPEYLAAGANVLLNTVISYDQK